MKTLLLVAVAAFTGFAIWTEKPKTDPLLVAREQAIREHRVTIAMTREEVTRSLGEPDSQRVTSGGEVVWTWKSGRWVKFAGRALVDSGIEAQAAVPSTAQSQPGYHYEFSPGTRRYEPRRNDAPPVSGLRKIGGG